MTLEQYSVSRQNNFDIIRLIFAFLVLFGHSFPISGNGGDPITAVILPYVGDWIGGIAVDGFFAISGFLVTGSFMQRGAIEFFASRVLRIYPGVLFSCFVMVFVIGPMSVSVSIPEYFSAKPWYFFSNSLLWDWTVNLPYAFSGNPFSGATNGSAWSLPVEIRCYFLTLTLGFFGIFDSRIRANVAWTILLFLVYIVPNKLPLIMFNDENRNIGCFLYYIIGSLFWINRSIISLSWILSAVLIFASVVAWKLGYLYYILPACYVYFFLMIVYKTPTISLKKFGDISFGVYLYAWPIQQLVWSQGQGAYMNVLLSTALVIPISYISWHYIEKPTLKLRKYLRANKLIGTQ